MTRPDVPAEAATALDRWLGGGHWGAEPIAGDASTRRYFRISSTDGTTSVATYYPPDAREGLSRFLAANAALAGLVPIPHVFHHDESVVLQQDVGSRSLADLLEEQPEVAAARYRDAARIVETFDRVTGRGRSINPPFDHEKFAEELDMTRTYYVERLRERDSRPLEELFARLAERLVCHPYTLCHRDYHGHNIYIFKDSIYVIDYQDVRLGPDTYDLASLLRDRGVWRRLGRSLEDEIVAAHAEARGERFDVVRRRYLETLLQRSIKAIGTFARLVVVNGRRQYLAYIEPTLQTVRECVGELDEWRELHALFPFESDTP